MSLHSLTMVAKVKLKSRLQWQKAGRKYAKHKHKQKEGVRALHNCKGGTKDAT